MRIFGMEIRRIVPEQEENTYSELEIDFLFRKILRGTIDRDLFLKVVVDELKDIVGNEYMNHLLTLLNKEDSTKDKREVEKWMQALREIKKELEIK